MTEQEIECRKCGAVIPGESKFCLSCGSKVISEPDEVIENKEKEPLKCHACGNEVPENSRFCLECGEELGKTSAEGDREISNDSPDIENEYISDYMPNFKFEKKELTPKGRWIARVTRAGIAFLCSVIMTVLCFLPIVNISIPEIDEDFSLKVTPIDSIVFLINSTKNHDIDEIQEEYLEIIEELEYAFDGNMSSVEYDDLSKKEKALLQKYMMEYVKASLEYEEVEDTIFLYVTAIFAMLYMVSCIALCVLSCVYLLSLLGLVHIRSKKLVKHILGLFVTVPIIMLCQKFSFSASGVSGYNVELTGISIAVIIITVCCMIVYAIISKIIGESKGAKFVIAKFATIGLSLLVIITVFSPVISTEVTGKFFGKTANSTYKFLIDAECFGGFLITENDVVEYEEKIDIYNEERELLLKDYFNKITAYELKEVRKGQADSANFDVLKLGVILVLIVKYVNIFISTPICYLLVLIAMGFVIRKQVLQICFADEKTTSIFEILVFVFSIIALAMSIVLVCVASTGLDKYRLLGYEVAIRFEAILMPIYALILLITTCIIKRCERIKKNTAEQNQ